VEEYIQPLWIVIFLFLALIVLFILSKLLIIRNKLKLINDYSQKIEALYAVEESESDEELEV